MTWLLKQLQGALRAATDEALAPLDLTASQAAVLSALAYGSQLSNAELARDSFVTPQSMVEILQSLEARGLIVRRPHPSGGRAMPAELTSKGAKQLLAVHLAISEIEEHLLSDLGGEERTRLRQLLERCLASLRAERSSS
ncbi:MAG TPA: MarR family transcriptional regulator [Bryobacteraceae bacterium]|nr:MarR family transcriptional regulator [Bryobacteraceae bacterium]